MPWKNQKSINRNARMGGEKEQPKRSEENQCPLEEMVNPFYSSSSSAQCTASEVGGGDAEKLQETTDRLRIPHA